MRRGSSNKEEMKLADIRLTPPAIRSTVFCPDVAGKLSKGSPEMSLTELSQQHAAPACKSIVLDAT